MGNCLQIPGDAYLDQRGGGRPAFTGTSIALRNGPQPSQRLPSRMMSNMSNGGRMSFKNGGAIGSGRPLPQAPNDDGEGGW